MTQRKRFNLQEERNKERTYRVTEAHQQCNTENTIMGTEQKHGKGIVDGNVGQCEEWRARQVGIQLYLSQWPSREAEWCEKQNRQ